MVKGYTQINGIYYGNTFSTVVRFMLLCQILVIIDTQDFKMYQMNIKTAFFYKHLNEKTYMAKVLKSREGLRLRGSRDVD